MNLNTVRLKFNEYLNKEMNFSYKGSRGQIEKFTGTITKLYPHIFVVLSENGFKRTFSYNDYVIGNIKIFY